MRVHLLLSMLCSCFWFIGCATLSKPIQLKHRFSSTVSGRIVEDHTHPLGIALEIRETRHSDFSDGVSFPRGTNLPLLIGPDISPEQIPHIGDRVELDATLNKGADFTPGLEHVYVLVVNGVK